MSEYIYVPKVDDVYTQGTVVFSREDIGDYKTGYMSDNSYNLKLGLYRKNGNIMFVYASTSAVNDIEIQVTIPSSEIVFTLDRIDKVFEGGYYIEIPYTVEPTESNVTIYNTLGDVLDAMGYPPTPGSDSGVVVTVIASPVETPPITEGVIVHAIAKLLDPNQQGGTSKPGGGHGTFDETSDEIPIPLMPDISAAQTGLIGLFRPSLSDLRRLGAYLWTNITDFIENLNKLFMNPMDYLIALNIFPCLPSVGARKNIRIGSFTTTIDMPPIESQWYEHNCGDIFISEFWGSALDYSPNTKISLFLPFIGSVQINTDEVMNSRLGVRYRVDLLSGECVAMVTVNDSVYYQFTGQCSVAVPLTGADWSRVYSAITGAVGTAITGGIGAAASGAAAGGATAALAGSRAAESIANIGESFARINETSKGVSGVREMRQRMLEGAALASDVARRAAEAPTNVGAGVRASRIANTINNSIGQVIGAKGSVQHSGTVSGSAGMLGVKIPYIIIEYPNQSLADNYKHFVGYPANLSGKLSDFNGYTECEQVIPNGFTGTDDELAELLEALKGGVYL